MTRWSNQICILKKTELIKLSYRFKGLPTAHWSKQILAPPCEMENKGSTVHQSPCSATGPARVDWLTSFDLHKNSSQGTVAMSILQMRNIKLREEACPRDTAQKGSGQAHQAASLTPQPLSPTPPGLSEEQRSSKPALRWHSYLGCPENSCLIIGGMGSTQERTGCQSPCSFGEKDLSWVARLP